MKELGVAYGQKPVLSTWWGCQKRTDRSILRIANFNLHIMLRTTRVLALLTGTLLLVGGGCVQQTVEQTTTEKTDVSATSTPADATETSGITLEAVAVGGSAVELSWTAPAGATLRALHSVKPDISFPGRAFWQDLPKGADTYVWQGAPLGGRFFRICIFENGSCTTYSNEVGLTVK